LEGGGKKKKEGIEWSGTSPQTVHCSGKENQCGFKQIKIRGEKGKK